MNAKQTILAVLDCRPIKKVTGYAFGTMMMGIALGIIIAVRLPHLGDTLYVVAGVFGIVGAVMANVYYYALKYRYRIVETPHETTAETNNSTPRSD